MKFKAYRLGLSESLITHLDELYQICSYVKIITENETGAT